MACFKRFNCRGPEIPGGQWGAGVDVCQFHLNACAKEFGAIDESFSSDYARIKLMPERKEAVRTCMRDLAGETDKEKRSSLPVLDRERHTADGYVKFSAFLSRYEHLCWFPPSHHVFLGFVRPDDFLELIRQGVLAKDPGGRTAARRFHAPAAVACHLAGDHQQLQRAETRWLGPHAD
jgi:hypothetical protein